MEEHALPKEAVAVIRPLQVELGKLRNACAESERGVRIAMQMAMAMMGLDTSKPYVLNEDGDKLILNEEESKDA